MRGDGGFLLTPFFLAGAALLISDTIESGRTTALDTLTLGLADRSRDAQSPRSYHL
jgi:hypothetical protein